MKQFKFKDKITFSQGRNGLVQTTGIEIYQSYPRIDSENKEYDCIRIFPVTSYDKAANCWLEIPVNEIENFIKELQTYVQGQP